MYVLHSINRITVALYKKQLKIIKRIKINILLVTDFFLSFSVFLFLLYFRYV